MANADNRFDFIAGDYEAGLCVWLQRWELSKSHRLTKKARTNKSNQRMAHAAELKRKNEVVETGRKARLAE